MNPVVGLDISKEESHGQAFLARGKPFKETFYFKHTRDGLANLHQVLKDLESVSKQRPLLILEATGHYQSPVIQFLEEHHYIYIVINPLISNRLRKSQLRKVKTDAADAYLLGELFYREEFEPFKKGVYNFSICGILQGNMSLFQRCVYKLNCNFKLF